MFIFDTDYTQKLPLKLSSSLSTNALGIVECSISTDSVFDLLEENNMRLPAPNGTIVDKGKKGKLHLFVYKFDRQCVTQCSKASSHDFKHSNEDEEWKFVTEMKLVRNVSWSFFCLDSNPNLELTRHFIDPNNLLLKPLFVFPLVDDEAHCMNCLYNALLLYLKTYSVEQIDKPGNTECFCRFSVTLMMMLMMMLILHSSKMMVYC